jgi:hypothetical protein
MMLNKYVGWIEHFFEGYVQFESLKVETWTYGLIY